MCCANESEEDAGWKTVFSPMPGAPRQFPNWSISSSGQRRLRTRGKVLVHARCQDLRSYGEWKSWMNTGKIWRICLTVEKLKYSTIDFIHLQLNNRQFTASFGQVRASRIPTNTWLKISNLAQPSLNINFHSSSSLRATILRQHFILLIIQFYYSISTLISQNSSLHSSRWSSIVESA